MPGLTPTRFRVRNFKNIDDSGWVPIDRVAALVGRNESGKTAVLKGLHKFNPATPEPFDPQIEFPRDRFTREYKNGADWPVVDVEFELAPALRDAVAQVLDGGLPSPNRVTFTRYYDGSLRVAFDPAIPEAVSIVNGVRRALTLLVKAARLVRPTSATDIPEADRLRVDLANWGRREIDALSGVDDFRGRAAADRLGRLKAEVAKFSGKLATPIVRAFTQALDTLLNAARTPTRRHLAATVVRKELPVFIYFENYGILDSAIYLPRFLTEVERTPNDSRVRTISAVFKHAGLAPREIAELGREEAFDARLAKRPVTEAMLRSDRRRKELRAMRLNAASNEVTERFQKWFGQRRHSIRYAADGDFFRIWISDDRRPGVDIELESRSKGFQWFFSFYVLSLVESQEGHKDAVILLDEPGLHLHATAQQELVAFFETLAQTNTLIYATHSPFLIDARHLERVRAIVEDKNGRSHVAVDGWPEDPETIFPLQAAAGYALIRGLFNHRKNVLVEGIADFYYLQALSAFCRAAGRVALPEDVYITPCGGAQHLGPIAALFLGQKVRPVVLYAGTEADRVNADALAKGLYRGRERSIVMLSDVLKIPHGEIEDLVGPDVVGPALGKLLNRSVTLGPTTGDGRTLTQRAAAAAGIRLPDGWRTELARRVVADWIRVGPAGVPAAVLARAETLFREISARIEGA